jgi:hypothetical protein
MMYRSMRQIRLKIYNIYISVNMLAAAAIMDNTSALWDGLYKESSRYTTYLEDG